jgi:hypothetical protein
MMVGSAEPAEVLRVILDDIQTGQQRHEFGV